MTTTSKSSAATMTRAATRTWFTLPLGEAATFAEAVLLVKMAAVPEAVDEDGGAGDGDGG